MADKWTVARALDEIARYIELSDPNPFRARAFQRAARAVENLEGDITGVARSDALYKTPGIGKAIGPIITELVETGASPYLEEMRARYPPGIFDLLGVPGLGLKKIGVLHQTFGIGSLDELEQAAREGRLAKLRGFGAKTEAKILDGIEKARRRESLFLLPTGLEIGEAMRERLAAIDEVDDAEVVGSVRRRLEVIRNVNLAVATRNREAVITALAGVLDQWQQLDDDTWKGTVRNEIDVLFHFSDPKDFGRTVLRTTGAVDFVAAFEAKVPGTGTARTEEQLFEKGGIAFVEPERRETADDLRRKKRGRLVEHNDLRGTFHVHTTYSDGRNTLREMLMASRERELEYVGISDHSKAAYYAGGLTEDRLREQQSEIARQEKEVAPLRVFRGSEADILPDGNIDYDRKTRRKFDFIVASIHSRFNMTPDEMTERILRALDDPDVTFLGHLTGRRLLSRDGYSMDFDRVFERAAERGVIMEINGNPQRLDLDWRRIGRALDLGVVFSIHPDAHSIAELSHVISGTWVARKAGLSPKHIFNTRPVEEVEEYLRQRKTTVSAPSPRASGEKVPRSGG
ncbi:MAG TPA: helix-hairpin-helix domain-containing protein [Thermoanaerobaculia bacterium]|nr:helix-hairpin-helix domain-containing protein [Thermoanaerobaculia bacterium]